MNVTGGRQQISANAELSYTICIFSWRTGGTGANEDKAAARDNGKQIGYIIKWLA
ncbi:hypothetical protein GCM10023228_14770 [Brevibacillus fulvus]